MHHAGRLSPWRARIGHVLHRRAPERALQAPRAVLTGVAVDRSVVQQGLVPVVVSLLRRRGFELVDTWGAPGETESAALVVPRGAAAAGVPDAAAVLLVVDAHPLREALLPPRSGEPPLATPRLRTLRAVDEALRRAWPALAEPGTAPPPERSLFAAWPASQDGSALVRRLAPGREQELAARLEEHQRRATPPFPVLAELSQWGINARTDLVDVDGERLVCRTFKLGREQALRAELRCYGLADEVEAVPEPVLTGPTWVLLPHMQRRVTLDVAHPRRLPIDLVRRCIDGYQALSDRGVGLLDFGPANVLLGRRGALAMIDFEHAYIYPETSGGPRPLSETPLGLGRGFVERELGHLSARDQVLAGVDVLKDYDRHWYPRTGIGLEQLERSSRRTPVFGR